MGHENRGIVLKSTAEESSWQPVVASFVRRVRAAVTGPQVAPSWTCC